MAKRGKGKKYHSGVHPFSSKDQFAASAEAGTARRSGIRRTSTAGRSGNATTKYDGGERLLHSHLTDDQIQDAFLSAANKLLVHKDAVIANGKAMLTLLLIPQNETERDKLLEEAQVVFDAVREHLRERPCCLDQRLARKVRRYRPDGTKRSRPASRELKRLDQPAAITERQLRGTSLRAF